MAHYLVNVSLEEWQAIRRAACAARQSPDEWINKAIRDKLGIIDAQHPQSPPSDQFPVLPNSILPMYGEATLDKSYADPKGL